MRKYKLAISCLGLMLIFITAFIYAIYPPISQFILLLGPIVFIAGIVSFLCENREDHPSGEDSWKFLSVSVMILGLFLWGVMSIMPICANDIRDMLNIYITIDVAILSVTFAAIAISPDRIINVLKDPTFFDKEQFKGFILVTAFMLLFSVFVDAFTYLSPDKYTLPLLFDTILYINSFLLGVTTLFTLVLTFVLMQYTSKILDKIL